MTKRFLLTILALSLLAFCADYPIVQNGEAKAELIIGANPTRTAQFAAYEMQHCISLKTGATLPIVASASGTPGTTAIYIGIDANKYDFTGEEYLVSFEDGKIHLVGNDNPDYGKVNYKDEKTFPPMTYYYRATLFAVYDFLEKACGFRFYSFGDDGIAFTEGKDLTVEPFSVRRRPDMDAFRDPYFEGKGNSAVTKRDKDLLLHRWRAASNYGYVNHNIYSIYYRYWKPSPVKAFKDLFIEPHPEWFAKRETGRQSSHIAKGHYNGEYVPSQLCYSADGPIKYFAEEANKVYNGENVKGARFGNIKRLPKAEFYYPIQPDDDQAVCQCPDCTKLMENDRLAYHFTWINKLAAESRKVNPDVKWATLAYGVARRRPANLEIDPNVSIQICMSMHAWWHPLVYKRQHGDYKEWVEKEGDKRMLTSWLYFLNPEIMAARASYKPFPTLYPRHTGEYISEFLEDGLRGVFAEIAIQSHELESYIMSRLIYDKSEDYHKIIDEYFDLYYGAAGPAMKQVYETIEEITFNPDNYTKEVLVNDNPKASYISAYYSEQNNWHLGTPERMATIRHLIAKAREKASTPKESARVEKFVKNIWEPAEQGFKDNEIHKAMRSIPVPRFALPNFTEEFNGNLSKVPFENGATISKWFSANGDAYDAKAEFRMLADSKFLYIMFSEDSTIPFAQKNKDFWLNGIELFFADAPGLDYKQLFIDVNGKYEFYSNEVVEGVERFNLQDVKIEVKNELTPEKWTVKAAIPLAEATRMRDGKPFRCNIIRSRFFKDEKPTPYYFCPIFTTSHKEGLQRMGQIFTPVRIDGAARAIEDIPDFSAVKLSQTGIPSNWEINPKYPMSCKVENGHCIFKSTTKGMGFVNSKEYFPIAPGESLEYEITGTCTGNVGCCILKSNGKGMKFVGTNWTTISTISPDAPTKVVVKVPQIHLGATTHFRFGFQIAPNATLDLTSLKIKVVK
ncbi:MAG: DUF4838 domain-containing protein [Victivallales bacterium]|nr:DUF4838 domain-containing protein [Victivallales bacterium]